MSNNGLEVEMKANHELAPRVDSRDLPVVVGEEMANDSLASKHDYNEEDGIFGPEPTEEEYSTLRRVSDKIPLAAWLIVLCELCERFTYYGLSGPFQNYIQFPVPGPGVTQPGAIGKGHQTATALTTFFQFFCYVTPIAGAIIADQYWGKYRTILIFCFIYMVGLLVLVLTAIPPAIAANAALPGLVIAMIVIGFGTGGIKSNVSPFMAEQYRSKRPYVKIVRGKKVIVDPAVTIQSTFNWFYWAINVGSLSSIATTNAEKYHSFWLAYLIPLVMFFGAIAVLVFGRKKYVRTPPAGSILLRAFRAVWQAFSMRKRNGKDSSCESILDYAKPSYVAAHTGEKTQLWTDSFVEELKSGLKACKVFLFFPIYWLCYNQIVGNLISQAAQMNTGGLPNDIVNNIDPITLIIFIPIFDMLIYPLLRRGGIPFHPIARITLGFITAALAMAWAAFTQYKIYQVGPNFDYTNPCDATAAGCTAHNDITVAWQVPSYFLIAISEIFASITGLEYAFKKAPASMKSIVMSVFLFMTAIGSALNFALVPVTVDPKLTWMYASLGIVTFVVGIVFYFFFRHYDKAEHTSTVNASAKSIESRESLPSS